ncbi:MAG: glutaredoxin family protein [Polyangiales bacterium]
MRSPTLVSLALLAALGACRGRANPAPDPRGVRPESPEVAPQVPFEVRANAEGLLFFWFDPQGNAHPAERVDDVPADRREVVRVDPSRPELRSPGWVYVTDLRSAGANGLYPTRAVRAQTLADQVLALAGHAGALGTPAAPPPAAPSAGAGATTAQRAPSGQPDVIVYGASWCSACHQAAAYLRSRHVAFVEKDIEQDPSAAREMQEKAARAGVPTGSIPILDVRGHILRGFSAPAIEQALQSG